MTTLPEKGEGIFGYKIMDRTTVSMLGAQITEFSHIYSGARVLYIENDARSQSPSFRKPDFYSRTD